MKMTYKKSIFVTIFSTVIFISGCGSDNNNDEYSSLSPKKVFNVDADVSSVVNVHDVFSYQMPSVLNKAIEATTLVFIPKGNAPIGGWPVVVWAHGTTGAADQCAPSRNALVGVEKNLILELVKKGYAVVAPDYEGLGNDNVAHPYLHLKSAAQSILFALTEVNKNYFNLSKDWSVIGWSQGGHAALAAAEFNQALSGFNYKGAVAIAPASYLKETLDFGMGAANQLATKPETLGTAVQVAATLYTYAAITSSGIKAEKPNFNYNQTFITSKIDLAKQAETLCSPELGQKFGADIQKTLAENAGQFSAYQALQANYQTDPDVQAYLVNNNPAQRKLDKKVYIFQGEADTTVPFAITQNLVAKMSSVGSNVELISKPGETHSTVVANNVNELVGKIDLLMK